MLKYIIVYLAVTYSRLCVHDCRQCNFPLQILQLIMKTQLFALEWSHPGRGCRRLPEVIYICKAVDYMVMRTLSRCFGDVDLGE